MRILLIDDSPVYREEFADLLAEGGLASAALDYADNAQDGARMMNAGQHDIYFVDYRLPGAKGTDLIHGARLAGVERPIFCLTGLNDPRLDQEAEHAGASFHLSKDGLSAGALSRTIRFALRHFLGTPMPRDAADRFRLAQEAANIGTWEWDVACCSITCDTRMRQLFGCAPFEPAQAADIWERALGADAFAAAGQMVRDCARSGEPFQSDFEVTWDDGSLHFMRAAGRAIKEPDGRARRVGGISWDITEIRLLVADLAQARDEAQRANKAKSRFLAGMSHELRTPLSGILGNARLLRSEGGLSASQAARVENMLSAGDHLQQMIQCVLDLSEIETERFMLSAEPMDVRLLARSCLDMVRNLAEAKGLGLTLSIAAEVPRLFKADPGRLRQILINLLGNATKFTGSGGVALRLHTINGGTALRFDVADTGPGVPQEKRHRLFQDFGRLQSDGTRAAEGAGLGLALSARLAALMGGRLGHADNPGGGSLFYLELPLAAVEEPHALAADEAADRRHAHLASGRRLNVLVADDSEMNLEIAASFMRLAGHCVTCVGSGAAAVQEASSKPFDIVLMDVQMPDMDGLEAARRIRALPGAAGQVPVIALSAQVFTEQLEACRLAGMNGHLAKPYTEAALFAVLAEFVPGAPADRRFGARAAWGGADHALPVIDDLVFATNTRLLKPTSVAAYLENIDATGRAVLRMLSETGPTMRFDEGLLRAVHKLTGNIGLFGFARAADFACRFEHAVRTGAADQHLLAAGLAAALDVSLVEAARRLNLAAG